MVSRLAAAPLLLLSLGGCLTYEYEHEFWLDVDGSGTVNVTGRPALSTPMNGLRPPEDPDGTATEAPERDVCGTPRLAVDRSTPPPRRRPPIPISPAP